MFGSSSIQSFFFFFLLLDISFVHIFSLFPEPLVSYKQSSREARWNRHVCEDTDYLHLDRKTLWSTQNTTIYMVQLETYIHRQRRRRTSTIVEGDYKPKTFKSQSPNYTKKYTLSPSQDIFLYNFLITKEDSI